MAHPACATNFTEFTANSAESSEEHPVEPVTDDSPAKPHQVTDSPSIPDKSARNFGTSAAWLAQLFLDERSAAYSSVASVQVRADNARPELVPQSNPFPSPRATDKGYLHVTLGEYLLLLDWTQQGLNPSTTPPESRSATSVLQRLGLDPHQWLSTIRHGFNRCGKWIVSPRPPNAT